MISIILPTYHEADSIGETLTAIFAAAHNVSVAVEVLLIDSSPDEATCEAAKAVPSSAHCPLRILKLPGKTGAGKARNRGVREARYPFIATVDAAVLVEETWLKVLWDAQQSSGADLVWGNTVHAPHNAFERSYLRSFHRPAFSRRFMNNLLIRKSVYLELGGLNEQVHSGEDLELFAKLNRSAYREVYVEAISHYSGYPSSVAAILRKWIRFTADNVQIGQAKAKFIFVSVELLSLAAIAALSVMNGFWGIVALLGWLSLRFIAQVLAAHRPFETWFEVPMTLGLILVFDAARALGLIKGGLRQLSRKERHDA